jgi:phenylpropionate dioxygenase-like ring-hydroxylating dioxygenase large terminal subunit
MAERWLLITLSTGGPSSTLRVHAWRKLRALGAHALGQSAYLVPQRRSTVRTVNRLMARVQREGARGTVLHFTLPDDREENETIARFSAERTDEYREIVERTSDSLAELAMERDRGRMTYTEVEESGVDLTGIQKWLAAVRARDCFDADGHAEAAAAVAACEQALSEFEAEAFASELAPERPEV